VHQHQIVGGYIWRLPEGLEGGMKAFQELVLPLAMKDVIPRPSPEEALQALNRYHIRYVVLRKGVWAAIVTFLPKLQYAYALLVTPGVTAVLIFERWEHVIQRSKISELRSFFCANFLKDSP
jgi:hypothetical protein